MEFSHTPRITVWSTVPGPARAAAGEDVEVQVEADFYGDGLSEGLTAQFWDDDAAGGSLVGTAGILTDPESDGIWKGSVTAVAGADKLIVTATDSEGSTTSQMPYAVP
jgi:hypothetical protein